MPKRNFPFDGTSPLQLKTHINAFHFEKATDMKKIHARTLELMLQGSRRQSAQVDHNDNVQQVNRKQDKEPEREPAFKCQSCLQSKSGMRVMCIFCERLSCTDCSRQCAHCAGIFCSLCSIANYDERCERYFCLGCSKC